MWGLFKVLEVGGYVTIDQKKAFIPLIKLADSLAEMPFLKEEDLKALSSLEKLEDEGVRASVPSFKREQEEAEKKLKRALKVLWCHSERLPLPVIAKSAAVIYPDLQNHFKDDSVCLSDIEAFTNIFLNQLLSQFNVHQDEFCEKIQGETRLLKPVQDQSDASTWTQTFATYAFAGAAGLLLFKGAQYLKENDYLDVEMPEVKMPKITIESAKELTGLKW